MEKRGKYAPECKVLFQRSNEGCKKVFCQLFWVVNGAFYQASAE